MGDAVETTQQEEDYQPEVTLQIHLHSLAIYSNESSCLDGSNRFWKKVFVKLGVHNDLPVIQLYSNKDDKEPFQELQLQPCYSVSDISIITREKIASNWTVLTLMMYNF